MTDQLPVNAEVIRVNGETIPVDKWRAGLWLVGKLSKAGMTVTVLMIILGWYLYDASEQRKRDDTRQIANAVAMAKREEKAQETLLVLASNQATLIKSVDQKNETIGSTHDMMISSRDRDERIIRLLTEVGEQLRKAGEVMSPLPEERKRQTKLLEEFRDGIEQLRNGS